MMQPMISNAVTKSMCVLMMDTIASGAEAAFRRPSETACPTPDRPQHLVHASAHGAAPDGSPHSKSSNNRCGVQVAAPYPAPQGHRRDTAPNRPPDRQPHDDAAGRHRRRRPCGSQSSRPASAAPAAPCWGLTAPLKILQSTRCTYRHGLAAGRAFDLLLSCFNLCRSVPNPIPGRRTRRDLLATDATRFDPALNRQSQLRRQRHRDP